MFVKTYGLNTIKTIPYIIPYVVYKVKLLLLRLVVESSSHVALHIQVCSAYLDPKSVL
jgi:hypothetical protein